MISRIRLVLGRSGKPRNESGISSESSEPENRRFTDSRGTTFPKDAGIKSYDERDSAAWEETGSRDIRVSDAERERALAALQGFMLENSTNVDRALRLRDRADRLEREGIPSDSAHNRASRAREEIVGGLAGLRLSLGQSGEPGAARALDLEVTRMSLEIGPGEIRR